MFKKKEPTKRFFIELQPKEDITAYELAQLTVIFTKKYLGITSEKREEIFNSLPENVKRHIHAGWKSTN